MHDVNTTTAKCKQLLVLNSYMKLLVILILQMSLILVFVSSEAGVILQDQDTLADLEQASKFNSTNQNMLSDAGTYHGVFLDRELYSQIYLCKTPMFTRTFSHVQTPIPVFWLLLKKPIGSTFWKGIALHLRGFMTIKIDSCVYRITSGVSFWREVEVMHCRFFEKLRSPFFDYFCGSYESMIHNCHFSPEMGSLAYQYIDHNP